MEDEMVEEERGTYANVPREKLESAVERLMVGGNSIASVLIGMLGPKAFTEWPDAATASRECYARLDKEQAYIAYENWLMWHACMETRRDLLGE